MNFTMTVNFVRFKRGFCIFRLLVKPLWYLVLIVLYDVSLAVDTLCNLARSVGTLSVLVAIGYELRLSTKVFLLPCMLLSPLGARPK